LSLSFVFYKTTKVRGIHGKCHVEGVSTLLITLTIPFDAKLSTEVTRLFPIRKPPSVELEMTKGLPCSDVNTRPVIW